MSPFESKTTPEPSPCELWIWTTDGERSCTTAVIALWNASAAFEGLSCASVVAGGGEEEPPPSETAATTAPATAAPASGASHQACRRNMGDLYRRSALGTPRR